MITFGRWARHTRGADRDAWEMLPQIRHRAPGAGRRDATPERECVEACRECHESCLEIAGYCVSMQGYYAEIGHVRLLEDCARVCELTLDFLLRTSEMRRDLAGVCVEVAERCAADCERFDYDQRLLECAAVCRRCAEACRRFIELPLSAVSTVA
jgi:hypothetical protein